MGRTHGAEEEEGADLLETVLRQLLLLLNYNRYVEEDVAWEDTG